MPSSNVNGLAALLIMLPLPRTLCAPRYQSAGLGRGDSLPPATRVFGRRRVSVSQSDYASMCRITQADDAQRQPDGPPSGTIRGFFSLFSERRGFRTSDREWRPCPGCALSRPCQARTAERGGCGSANGPAPAAPAIGCEGSLIPWQRPDASRATPDGHE